MAKDVIEDSTARLNALTQSVNSQVEHEESQRREKERTAIHQVPQFGSAKGKVEMSNDFNEPDFAPLPSEPQTRHDSDCPATFSKEPDSCICGFAPPQYRTCGHCGHSQYNDNAQTEWRHTVNRSPTCPAYEAPPDQHVVPPRIWWSKKLDCVIEEAARNKYKADVRTMNGYIEYLAIAPIQAALEACEEEAGYESGGYVVFPEELWEALVAAMKG